MSAVKTDTLPDSEVIAAVRETLSNKDAQGKYKGDRFIRPSEIGSPAQRSLVLTALSNIVRGHRQRDRSLDVKVSRVTHGIYWVSDSGAMPSGIEIARQLVRDPEFGVGHAGKSAAFKLGLAEKPKIEEVALIERPPRGTIANKNVRFVMRSSRDERSRVGLLPPEWCLLEVLADPSVIEVEHSEAVKIIFKLLRSDQVSVSNLVAVSESEPAITREGLRNILVGLGQGDKAQEVIPSQAERPKQQAFDPAKGE